MVSKRFLWLALSLTGCSDASGVWEGDCVMDESSVEMSLDLSLSGKEASGSAIAGFDDAGYLYFRDGEISGTVQGSTVSLTVDFDDGASLEIEAEHSGDTMDGTCSTDAGEGVLELDR